MDTYNEDLQTGTEEEIVQAEPVAAQIQETVIAETVLAEEPVAEETVPVAKPESPFANSPYVLQKEISPSRGKKEKKKSASNPWRSALAFVLALLILMTACGTTAYCVNLYCQNEARLQNQVLANKLSALQAQLDALKQTGGSSGEGSAIPVPSGALTPRQVYENTVEAVVAVNCNLSSGQSFGSGFIISKDGYVVTNHHVIDKATSVSVQTVDGKEYVAKIIGSDDVNDVALLKIEGKDFKFVSLASSASVSVGDMVVTIGNPLGELTSTLTVGYVSAKERSIVSGGLTLNMIQTDAAINSGNSGGPLLNMNGDVIGIITSKYSGTSNSGTTIEGIGFAVPVDDVKGVLSDLMQYGKIRTAYLGVMVKELDAYTAEIYSLPVGVRVESVTEGGAAYRAGVRAKDIILNIGGYDTETMAELTRALRELEPGDQTTITVFRQGREISMNITLDEKPAS